MHSLVGGGLGGVQRRNLSVAHQKSNVVLVACCLTGVEVVPHGGWDSSPELSDGWQSVPGRLCELVGGVDLGGGCGLKRTMERF